MRNKYTCLACGSTDQALQQDNGELPTSVHFALLCLAPDVDGPQGHCGNQWEPNMLDTTGDVPDPNESAAWPEPEDAPPVRSHRYFGPGYFDAPEFTEG